MADAQKKILIVEDSESYRFVLSESLREAGFIVAIARNGEEGLDAIKSDKPDLVLLDITMPKMDGITMSQKLKEEGIKLPIIFLTNMSDIKHVTEATATATDYMGYIVKVDTSVDEIVVRVKERFASK